MLNYKATAYQSFLFLSLGPHTGSVLFPLLHTVSHLLLGLILHICQAVPPAGRHSSFYLTPFSADHLIYYKDKKTGADGKEKVTEFAELIEK